MLVFSEIIYVSLPIKILLKLPRNMTVNSNQSLNLKAVDIKQVIIKITGKNLEEYL